MGKGIVIGLHRLPGWFDERQRMFFWVKIAVAFFAFGKARRGMVCQMYGQKPQWPLRTRAGSGAPGFRRTLGRMGFVRFLPRGG